MKVLALDTSTLMTTCGLVENGIVLGEFSIYQDMSHSEKLIPMIKELLDRLRIPIKDIDLYGVGIGPGSFTGLRIGAATMKSLAHVFDKPMVGVGSLESLAFNLVGNEIIVPILDARRDRVYRAIYSFNQGKLKEIKGPDVVHLDRLIEEVEEYDDFILNGDGVFTYRDRLKDLKGARFSTGANNLPRAGSIGELARLKYDEFGPESYFSLVPDYLRKSQAERELEERKK